MIINENKKDHYISCEPPKFEYVQNESYHEMFLNLQYKELSEHEHVIWIHTRNAHHILNTDANSNEL